MLSLIRDPQFDSVREERVFQAFVDRVGGRDFRRQLEELARRPADEEAARSTIEPRLELPGSDLLDEDALKLER